MALPNMSSVRNAAAPLNAFWPVFRKDSRSTTGSSCCPFASDMGRLNILYMPPTGSSFTSRSAAIMPPQVAHSAVMMNANEKTSFTNIMMPPRALGLSGRIVLRQRAMESKHHVGRVPRLFSAAIRLQSCHCASSGTNLPPGATRMESTAPATARQVLDKAIRRHRTANVTLTIRDRRGRPCRE